MKIGILTVFLFAATLISAVIAFDSYAPFIILETEKATCIHGCAGPSLHGYVIETRDPWVELYPRAQPLNTSMMTQAIGSTAEDLNWNPDIDFYPDGEINVLDALVFSYYFQELS